MQQEMYKHWGYLLQTTGPHAAPVWVGEFGTFTTSILGVHDLRGNSQGHWFSALVHYLRRYPTVGWAYWALNGTTSSGPGRTYGARDDFGLLTRDWAHLSLPVVAGIAYNSSRVGYGTDGGSRWTWNHITPGN